MDFKNKVDLFDGSTVNNKEIAKKEEHYTKIEIQTSGQAQVHWDNVINVPAFEPAFTKNSAFNKSFAGTGSALTVARSDHDHNTSYLSLNGGTLKGTLDLNNNNLTNVNTIQIMDPGPNEGLEWIGGNDWKIYESPNDLTTNSGGNLQFVTGTTRQMTLDTTGQVETIGGYKTGKFAIQYNSTEDSLDFIYTG